MPRPRKCRKVCCLPKSMEFFPGSVGKTAEPVVMTVDEYETIRLIDREGLLQEECALYMDIARTTVQQIYGNARKKIALAIVDARPLRIEGGDYELCDGVDAGCTCRHCERQRRERENRAVKILIPVDDTKEDVCIVFGRTPYFLIRDIETGEERIIENPAANAEGGAGLKAAQAVIDAGADVVLTCRLGENGAAVFKEAGISIYKVAEGKAKDWLDKFEKGELSRLEHFHAGYHGAR